MLLHSLALRFRSEGRNTVLTHLWLTSPHLTHRPARLDRVVCVRFRYIASRILSPYLTSVGLQCSGGVAHLK